MSQQQRGGIPVLILKEGTQRTVGMDARRSNIQAARVIAEILATSLGPRGMDKLLIDAFGDVEEVRCPTNVRHSESLGQLVEEFPVV